jgi:hypothetical protein
MALNPYSRPYGGERRSNVSDCQSVAYRDPFGSSTKPKGCPDSRPLLAPIGSAPYGVSCRRVRMLC